MIGTKTPALRFKGSGDKLRLRVTTVPDPLANVRECCRASVAVEKALGEAIRGALSAGHSWAEIGTALGALALSWNHHVVRPDLLGQRARPRRRRHLLSSTVRVECGATIPALGPSTVHIVVLHLE